MTTRAAIYARISSDPRGDEEGVEGQQARARALAAALQWDVVAMFVDNDISITKGKAGPPRPGYTSLCALITAGQVDQVIANSTGRLWRNRSERAEGIDLFARHKVGVKALKGADSDLSSAMGRALAGVQGEFDTWEAETISERVRDTLAQNSEEGRPHGPAAYGWTRTHNEKRRPVDVVDPAEAAVVQEIARRILAGDSLRGIVIDLNARGVPSPWGRPWGKQMLRAVVVRERNVALRRHRGVIVGPGTWDPILEVGVWEQVRAVLADPARRTSTGTAAAHLLSGIATCGPCGGLIRAGLNRTVASYRCADRSCVSRNRADVDEWVTRSVLRELRRFDPTAFAADRPAAQAAIDDAAALRARLDLAADAYAEGSIDDRQLARITARLRPQMEAADARARQVDAAPLLEGLIGAPDPEARWEDLSLPRRRAVTAFLVTVTIHRTSPGARVFDTATVTVKPRR